MLRQTPSPPVVASPLLLVWGDSTNPGQTPPGCCTAAAEEEEEEEEDGLGVRDQSAKRFHRQQLAQVCSLLALAAAGSEVNPGLTEI